MTSRPGALATGVLLAAFTVGGCNDRMAARTGTCAPAPSTTADCTATVDAGVSGAALGLVAYSCTGTARPDDAPTYIEGVPQGIVCADHGAASDDGTRTYCCTAATTTCAYNPVGICDTGTTGFQCQGADRPESLNAALTCGQGVYEGDLIDYCCAGAPYTAGCLQSDSVGCSAQMIGWTCLGQNLPAAQELGASKSRADDYYLLCATPTPAANPAYNNYCCYTPALVPAGGSCVQDTTVPGCAPGRFGFACTGRDTPSDDYLPMHCPDRGVPGRGPQGYPSTLYCCDFQS